MCDHTFAIAKVWYYTNMAKYYYSPTKQKVILLLWAGVALGLAAYSPRRRRKVFKDIPLEFKKIDRRVLQRIIREFHRDRLVDFKEDRDGGVRIILTEQGIKKALRYNIDTISIKEPKKWDGKWRLVIFDIPEKMKKAREALRDKLRKLGFYQLQKSVFVFPFVCHDEINFIVEFFELRPHVRIMTVLDITNEAELKLYFRLS
ncbi:MAG: Transcriptional regulator, PaaX family [Candidatus Giovannonibacteria bacterium GW2011_GWA1_43_15]|uniref:Transcriptional regulator, PaaX family n=2 Tax=Candidatus Giovannoniibacteriota TaxID=1752738 RepID=A0A0G1IW20_9BACT|nr:MAG: Transcriptional regulator, PaaX family [Candidatus Giovannonibacteria bacterium GW2011_GWB1_43_13]KKS99270.1 MAG: Transcriptional regulator, PaaX family [Candidatus Giovannonibacteria bacterium GW2011_GWA1_43_15]KKT21081.1 MAG: Transcriptional regulator, PaaX family [Candidatus Giovannonibacteria bacterium GW2011_GWC2_43_8]KKT63153.1 MAG: Transcriptional regulator, PaaX family [Candidatus Giovannonibacteria bacterium GW2011_GWA2_44_26]